MRVFSAILLLVSAAAAQEKWLYLDNGRVRLGVNLGAGACIGWLSHSGSPENVLNAYDVGRYVQQSYYGDADGSDWAGKPWRYNPVQGGSWKNEPAEVVETKSDATSLYAKTIPRHWATGVKTAECVMEQWLHLDGGLARLKFRMSYRGKKAHMPRHQELPALFVEPQFDTLVFLDAKNELTRLQPGFPNEYHRVAGSWCAWVDAQNKGIGLHMPHARQITCYRVRNGNKADCSYLAPIQTFALKPGLVFEYEVVLTLGTLEQIRAAFNVLK